MRGDRWYYGRVFVREMAHVCVINVTPYEPPHCAARDDIRDIVVSVELFAAQSKERLTRLNRSAIRANRRDPRIRLYRPISPKIRGSA